MDDREFFDHLFQLWSKTTGAQDTYWMPEKHFDNSGRWNVFAVAKDDSRKKVASGLGEWDADFLTAVHGCLPDLVRRLHAALDEAENVDFDRDSRECRIAELEGEVAYLKKILDNLSTDPPWVGRED